MKIFIHVTNKNQALAYIAQRLGEKADDFKNTIAPENLVKNLSLPLITESEYQHECKKLSTKDVAELRDRQACGLKYINKSYPLLTGEELLNDSFSYLKERYGSCVAGSPVLIRHTSQATLYYVFDFHQWSGKEVSLQLPVPPKHCFMPLVTRGEVVEKLFISLLKGLAEKAGGSIFELVFPEQNFEVDYQRIAGIVKPAVNQNTIDEENGKINGVVNYMKYTYGAAVKQSKSQAELIALLRIPEASMNTIIGTLATDPFRKPGLTVYIQAVAMAIGVWKEMAIQDKGDANYKTSQYYLTSIVKMKSDAIKHINNTFEDIAADRKNHFTKSDGTACRSDEYGYGPEFYKYYMWKDNYTGKESSFNKEKGYDAEAARNNNMLSAQNIAVDTERTQLKIDIALNYLNAI